MKEYYVKDVIKLLKSIGYRQRVEEYYVINELDGYINVNYQPKGASKNDKFDYIEFHKNYYYGTFSPLKHNDNIHTFYNFQDFEHFMSIYHKKEVRKIKLKKINDKKQND